MIGVYFEFFLLLYLYFKNLLTPVEVLYTSSKELAFYQIVKKQKH